MTSPNPDEPGTSEAAPVGPLAKCPYSCSESGCSMTCGMPSDPTHPFRDCLCSYHWRREPRAAPPIQRDEVQPASNLCQRCGHTSERHLRGRLGCLEECSCSEFIDAGDVAFGLAACRAAALEEAANVARSMVVGGRAWTHDQSVAADALLACAKNIAALSEGGGTKP